jgi:hypothetical protein
VPDAYFAVPLGKAGTAIKKLCGAGDGGRDDNGDKRANADANGESCETDGHGQEEKCGELQLMYCTPQASLHSVAIMSKFQH